MPARPICGDDVDDDDADEDDKDVDRTAGDP